MDFNSSNDGFPNTERNKKDIYFAAHEDPKDTAGIALQKGQSFFNLLRANAYLEKLNRMWRYYHGAFTEDLGYGHKIDFSGEQGEYTNLMVNHFRNIAQHMFNMVTSNRLIMEARAINTDYKSLAQTHLANGILDYYMREKGLETVLKRACEMAIVLGSSYVRMEWNATAGEAHDYDEETGQYTYEGEMEFSLHSQFDVVTDGTKDSWDKQWVLVRTFQNRYNLMAKYPELADKIKGMSAKNQSAVYRLATFSNDDTDDIPVYEFYHERTEAVPDGRYILFVDPEVVLLDTKLPYRQVPVFRMSAGDIMGTPYGYTPMFDIFPLQQGVNSLYSTIMTNQNAFGVQNLYVPRGADINLINLQGSMNVIEANAKPEPLNLTETPAEVFKFLEMLIQSMETISGVNSVARGNPEASLRTGNALALVQSMALQFISGLQGSYVKLTEDIGTALIQTLKDYATTPKIVALVGKNNRPLLKEFTGESISAINRVVVDIGNPLSRSIAGRVQMAEQMLQMGVIKNPQQYFQILNTGKIDSLFEGEMDELMLVKRENELMLDGEVPLVSPLDAHRMHINEHKAVLSDPDLRSDPAMIKNVMDHVQAHLEALKNVDPDLLQMVGEQPLPPPQPPMPMGPDGQPLPPDSMSGATPEMMSPEAGSVVAGEAISGPGVKNVPNPGIPSVDPSLLPNPQMQDQAMGNLKVK